jgi:hypothetical protein
MTSSNSTIAIVFAALGLVLVLYAMWVSEQSRSIYGHSLPQAYASVTAHPQSHFGGR